MTVADAHGFTGLNAVLSKVFSGSFGAVLDPWMMTLNSVGPVRCAGSAEHRG